MAAQDSVTSDRLIRENEALRAKLAEAEHKLADTESQLAEAQEVIRAIQSGDVDAVVVSGPQGDQIFTLKDAEYAYRALVEAMNEGAATLGVDGTVLYCNQRLSSLLGIPIEQIIGNKVSELVAAESKQDFKAFFVRAKSGDACKTEIDFLAGTGDLIPVYVSLREMHSEGGALCMVVTDLTERNERDRIIANERQRLFDVLETLPAMICLLTPDHQVSFANRSFREKFGESHGRRCYEYRFDRTEPCNFCESHEVLKTGKPHQWELTGNDGSLIAAYDLPFIDVDGSPLILEMGIDITEGRRAEAELARHREHLEELVREQTSQLRDANAQLQADISERKRAEEQLQKLNRALKAQSDSSQALLHVTDESAYLQEVCRIVTEDCGHAMMWIGFAQDDENKTVRPVAYSGFETGYLERLKFTWDDSKYGSGPTGKAIRTGRPSMCRDMLTDPDFAPWREEAVNRGYRSSLVVPLMEEDKSFGAFSIYSREPDAFSAAEIDLMTELAADLSFGIRTLRLREDRKRAEAAMQENARLLALALEAGQSGFFDWDLVNNICRWSPELECIYGLEPGSFNGSLERWHKWVVPEDLPVVEGRLLDALGTGTLSGEWRIIRQSDGEIRWLSGRSRVLHDESGNPVRLVGVNVDITERKLSEHALLRSEKLASVGRMASTIAHEINNPLETIGNAVYLAATDPGIPAAARSHLDIVTQELERVSHIVRQTLAFHRGTNTPTLVDLRESIDNVLRLFAPRLESRGVKVVRRCPEVGRVRAFGGEIQQVISNLLSNSMDAVPNHGKIQFRLSRRSGGNGDKVRFTIADTGSGIAPARLANIFEPFFTTKEMHGTGLGLWVTNQIVEKHGATIRVRSKLGRGTVFSIVFPAAEVTPRH